MNRVFHRSTLQVSCVALALTVAADADVWSTTPLFAQEPAETSAQLAAEPLSEPSEDRTAEKRRKAMAGLMALAGILIGGVMFLAVVIIWGARLRRMARRQLPPQTTLQNDLWFLKPSKSAPADENPAHPEPPSPSE